MNLAILQVEVQNFIQQNLKTDLTKLIFKGSPFKNITVQALATQIEGKAKCEKKLPTWFSTKNIYYPPKLNIEQTSSEVTAQYKTQLVSGKNMIDITGGFGIDSWALSSVLKTVTHCEINADLSAIAQHNFKQLNVNNIDCIPGNGIAFLKQTAQKFDVIYIDPSRRDEHKGKVFLLKDCLPNVPEHLNFLFSKASTILLKNAPILDITSAVNELKFVKEIHVVAVNNDVKELLFLLETKYVGNIKVRTTNFQKNKTQTFNFTYQEQGTATYSAPQTYVYEPNAAILKSGGFQHLSQQLNIAKLHQHTHLYTAETLIDFPGRAFKIVHKTTYNKKELQKLIPTKKANITTRNFPETVAQIRKKTGIKDGGNLYLFFTTNLQQKHIVLICEKV